MKIGKHTVPSVTYSLKVEGEVVDKADESRPLEFIAGLGMMIPGFESQLEGKSAGDTFEIEVASKDAYGPHDPKGVIPLPLKTFEVDGKVDMEVVKVGASMPMQDQEGNALHGLIVKLEEENVIMDFNHVLAGKDLHFTGQILDVRKATSEEIEHGHVHGPNGHQH